MGEYFGTDGIRGRAGRFPLDEETIGRIGWSLASRLMAENGGGVTVLIGRDTRESGEWIEAAIGRGIAAAGSRALSAGVITTPGVAYLTGEIGAAAGVVISASHNPADDNGIKIFAPSRRKLSDQMEAAIEEDLRRRPAVTIPTADPPAVETNLVGRYLEYLEREVASGLSLDGLTLTIDCANGAASHLAPQLFASLGARLHVLHAEPGGRNINLDCGSLHPESLQRRVVETGSDLGIAFDGDADRMLAVDERGDLLDGDAILFILARAMKERGNLASRRVVATVMSNLGLEAALADLGIELARTAVGDRYVLDELLRGGGEIGGEQSGHIIFPAISLAGDGLITAIELLRVRAAGREPISSLAAGMVRFPQILLSVAVARKPPFETIPEIAGAVSAIESELSLNGRLLLRYSGTENIARIMIEGRDGALIEARAHSLAELVRRHLGA